ncbi:MAG: ADP-forming succinate--CoA ligase subunit beta [Burkholderiaceae bacterium]|nr:MAG: ADP-forming succinate--CoA ligase subunit beta [Burkholderiaceae bacterium]
MNIHEYQGKQLLKRYDVNVPMGLVVFSAQEGIDLSDELPEFPLVLKAQIHSGGRGKAGGIKFVKNRAEYEERLRELFQKQIFTRQSKGTGKTPSAVLIEEMCQSVKDFYFGIIVDRNCQKICVVLSSHGGVNVEEKDYESEIKKVFVNVDDGINESQFTETFDQMGLEPILKKKFYNLIRNLYNAFFELDATLIEINPLVQIDESNLIALDSKWNFDPNGLKRQPDILSMRDPKEEEGLEIESAKYNLSYIKLDGNIGCMVNGAGLAMATMDIIKLMGGSPANFLDVGGGASVEKVSKAFEILVSNLTVKVVLINIFGGIMRCDYVAQGVVNALQNISNKVPIVARIKGFKEEEAKRIIKESRLAMMFVDDLEEAVNIAVRQAKET